LAVSGLEHDAAEPARLRARANGQPLPPRRRAWRCRGAGRGRVPDGLEGCAL